jgi:hypothetical protein
MITRTDGADALATEAVLVLDTRKNQRQLGARSLAFLDRRLLFHAPTAHLELRLPPAATESGEPAWLYGQFVAIEVTPPVPGPLQVRLLPDGGETRTVEAGETGDFAMPCDPSASFWLECRMASGEVVRARCEA